MLQLNLKLNIGGDEMDNEHFWIKLKEEYPNDETILEIIDAGLLANASLVYDDLLDLQLLLSNLKGFKDKYPTELIDKIENEIYLIEEDRMEKVKIDFGQFIRHIREKKGITLLELSNKSGVSVSYLSRLEKADRNPPNINIVYAIAKGLDVPFHQIVRPLGLEPGIDSNPFIDIDSPIYIRDLLLENPVSVRNMGPALNDEKKNQLLDIVDFVSNSEWNIDKENKIKMLIKLVDRYTK